LLRRIEDAPQVPFRFANVLAHDSREVDPVKVKAQLIRQNFRGHRFASAAGSGEQRAIRTALTGGLLPTGPLESLGSALGPIEHNLTRVAGFH
jgi:hypothetical protein